jgi:MoaA/NifB/PqqE/SkfB family radical SAM enzyme
MLNRAMNIPWQKIVSFGQQTMLDADLFSVSWILGRFCNYKCSYCWPYANSQTPDYQELEVYKRAVDEIRCQAAQNGFTKFHWSFSGGEPTAYKHSIELMSKVLYDSIHMTTNLSPGTQWWDRWLGATSLSRRRSITASFHDEFANETEFGDKILYLMDNGVFVTVNQVMVPGRFDELYSRLKRFSDRGINVTLKPQSNETASGLVEGYTEEQVRIMQDEFNQHVEGEEIYQIRLTDGQQDYYLDQAERFNSFGFNKFQGWSCNSGYQSVIIRSNEVKRGYSCHEQPLGTLTDGFRLFDRPQQCITASCVSSADSKIPKYIKQCI